MSDTPKETPRKTLHVFNRIVLVILWALFIFSATGPLGKTSELLAQKYPQNSLFTFLADYWYLILPLPCFFLIYLAFKKGWGYSGMVSSLLWILCCALIMTSLEILLCGIIFCEEPLAWTRDTSFYLFFGVFIGLFLERKIGLGRSSGIGIFSFLFGLFCLLGLPKAVPLFHIDPISFYPFGFGLISLLGASFGGVAGYFIARTIQTRSAQKSELAGTPQ